MLGPFSSTEGLPQLHINRFGVIPKGHNTGKWRMITDLSFPSGRSVNDGIGASLDDVTTAAARLGPGALLAKVDIKSAYRLLPVHLQDRPLLAIQWDGKIFVDMILHLGFTHQPRSSMQLPTCSAGTYNNGHTPAVSLPQ